MLGVVSDVFIQLSIVQRPGFEMNNPPLSLLPPGSEEGGVSTRALQSLQLDRPLPGASEGLRMRGSRRRQGATAPGLEPHLYPGGRHGSLQEDAGAHVSPAGCCREPSEEGEAPGGGGLSVRHVGPEGGFSGSVASVGGC